MKRSNGDLGTPSRVALWAILWLALFGAVLFTMPGAEAAGTLRSEEKLLSRMEDTVPSGAPTRGDELLFPYRPQVREYGSLLIQPPTAYDLWYDNQKYSILPFESPLGGFGSLRNSSGLFYNLFQESDYFPGLFLYGHVNTSEEGSGRWIDTQLKLMAIKNLGGSNSLRRVHMNLSWKYNDDSRDNERDDSYVAIVGYDQSISPDLLIVLDFVRERESVDFRNLNILQMGLRYNLTPLTVLSLGAGSSLSFDTPELRAVFGFQHSF